MSEARSGADKSLAQETSPYGYPYWEWVAREDPEYANSRFAHFFDGFQHLVKICNHRVFESWRSVCSLLVRPRGPIRVLWSYRQVV